MKRHIWERQVSLLSIAWVLFLLHICVGAYLEFLPLIVRRLLDFLFTAGPLLCFDMYWRAPRSQAPLKGLWKLITVFRVAFLVGVVVLAYVKDFGVSQVFPHIGFYAVCGYFFFCALGALVYYFKDAEVVSGER